MTLRERGQCARCGRYTSVKIPKGGDGSELVPYRHRKIDGSPCDGHYYAARKTPLP